MVFQSPVFLFLFLPIFLTIYLIAKRSNRNFVLLVFSIVFIAWSDPFYFLPILVLSLANFGLFCWMQRKSKINKGKRSVLILGIMMNGFSLLFFKLFPAYGETWINALIGSRVELPGWLVFILPYSFHQPLGISFFFFQAISMLVDGFRNNEISNVSLGNAINYLLMFPKVIAGPILKFRQAICEVHKRVSDLNSLEIGVRRFIRGFAKKTLIADQLALITDRGIFNAAPSHLSLIHI